MYCPHIVTVLVKPQVAFNTANRLLEFYMIHHHNASHNMNAKVTFETLHFIYIFHIYLTLWKLNFNALTASKSADNCLFI